MSLGTLPPIQDEARAYALGVLAGSVRKLRARSLTLRIVNKTSAQLIQQLLPEARLQADRIVLSSKSRITALADAGIIADAANAVPEGFEGPIAEAFTRGLFEGAGHIPACKAGATLQCSLQGRAQLLRPIAERHPGAHELEHPSGLRLLWHDENALDLLGRLYQGAQVFRRRWHKRYLAWAGHVPTTPELEPKFFYQLLDPHAVAPFKARVSDSGYDLTVIRPVKQHGLVTLFGTGISVQPPFGWYFDVVPRSSIVKSGYISANSIGVIDRSYRGEVMVPLIKIDPAAPELPLPARVAQMIPRPIVHLSPVAREALNSTQRGVGGFGSTGT